MERYFYLSVLKFSFSAEIHPVLTFALSSESLKFDNSHLNGRDTPTNRKHNKKFLFSI